MGYHNT